VLATSVQRLRACFYRRFALFIRSTKHQGISNIGRGPGDRLGAAILHDEAGAVVFGRSGLRHYLSSFVRPLLSATQKEISVSLNNQKVRFK
jgi:hypothetical protein